MWVGSSKITLRLPSPLTPAYNPPFLDLSSTEGRVKRIKAIYPGSFDPPTNGHLDLIDRGSKIFDELVVAILRNPDKDPLFNVSERAAMLEALTGQYSNVRVETVFMMPAEKYSYLSSRLVREVAQLGGSVKGLVPELVEQNLKGKLDPAY